MLLPDWILNYRVIASIRFVNRFRLTVRNVSVKENSLSCLEREINVIFNNFYSIDETILMAFK